MTASLLATLFPLSLRERAGVRGSGFGDDLPTQPLPSFSGVGWAELAKPNIQVDVLGFASSAQPTPNLRPPPKHVAPSPPEGGEVTRMKNIIYLTLAYPRGGWFPAAGNGSCIA